VTGSHSSTAVEIETRRFLLRSLTALDATEVYLGWLQDPSTAQFITTAKQTKALADLRRYVLDRTDRDDVVFLGIFEKHTARHIGNVKYEPIDSRSGRAMMGILIGNPEYRGRGVAREVLDASAAWLKAHRAIKQIVLGVNDGNAAAISAYLRAGFVVAESDFYGPAPPGVVVMVRHL